MFIEQITSELLQWSVPINNSGVVLLKGQIDSWLLSRYWSRGVEWAKVLAQGNLNKVFISKWVAEWTEVED